MSHKVLPARAKEMQELHEVIQEQHALIDSEFTRVFNRFNKVCQSTSKLPVLKKPKRAPEDSEASEEGKNFTELQVRELTKDLKR